MTLLPAQCLIMFPEHFDSSKISYFIGKMTQVDSRVIMFPGAFVDPFTLMVSALATDNIVMVHPELLPHHIVFQIAVLAAYFKVNIRTMDWQMQNISNIYMPLPKELCND